jgi:GDP-L-fucose synthase
MSPQYQLAGKRVFIAGHRGMVGSALIRRLKIENCEILAATHDQLELTNQAAVNAWMGQQKPQAVFLAASRVGGILANSTFPAEFLYENMMIEANIINAAHVNKIEKLLFFGSTCIYPKMAPQPIKEESLLTGTLEPTNEAYAIAKIAGIKLCQAYRQQYGSDYISAQPTNLYGPGDNYDLNRSHVLPALLRKAHTAKQQGAAELVIWGSGKPLREFMHVDDLADASVFLMKHYSDGEPVNIGSGAEVSIRELAERVCKTVGFTGKLVFDATKPDGTPRKLTDTTKLRGLGWNNARSLTEGLTQTYRDVSPQWT